MNNNKKIKALVVIGNGFDLSLNLPSSYNDFLNSLPVQLDGFENHSIWPAIIKQNLESGNLLWRDIEYAIRNFVIDKNESSNIISMKKVHDYSPLNDIHSISGEVNYEFILNRVKNVLEFEHFINPLFKNTLQIYYKNTLKQVIKFEELFKKYMMEKLKDFNYEEKSTKWLQNILTINDIKSIYEFKEIFILNFNYTSIMNNKNKFYDFNVKVLERNIHGTLPIYNSPQNIIFGIDSKDINISEDPEIYKLTKTYRVMNNNIKSTVDVPLQIPNNLNYIYFYGHSLGEQDYSYFQSIFDSIDLYNQKTILRFIYSDYFNANPEEEKEIINTRVAKLIETYGRSFKQESDRGKNLLHKLIVENRLEIIRLNPEQE